MSKVLFTWRRGAPANQATPTPLPVISTYQLRTEANDNKSEEINAISESQAEDRPVCSRKRFFCPPSCLLCLVVA